MLARVPEKWIKIILASLFAVSLLVLLACTWDNLSVLRMDDLRALTWAKGLNSVIECLSIQEHLASEELAVDGLRRKGDASDLLMVRRELSYLSALTPAKILDPTSRKAVDDLRTVVAIPNSKLNDVSNLPQDKQAAAAISIIEASALQKNLVEISSRLTTSLRQICESRRKTFLRNGAVSSFRSLDRGRLLLGFASLGAIAVLFALVFYYIRKRESVEAALKEAEIKLRAANLLLEEQAHTDPLTGALNRRGLEKQLPVEISRAERHKQQLAVLLIDCDDFKAINESAGHDGGDAVLIEIARRLKMSMRMTDLVARIGGDEFVTIFLVDSPEDAASIAERVRELIAAKPVATAHALVRTTVSVALSKMPQVPTIENMLSETRTALQESKKLGKNRVTCASLHGAANQI